MYQARWISKARLETLRKMAQMGSVLVLNSVGGFLIVEPVGSKLGDGRILSPDEADYEVSPVWCQDLKTKITQARALLGLEAGSLSAV